MTEAKRKLIEDAVLSKTRREAKSAETGVSDALRAMIQESINDKVRRGIEDADYGCCAHVDLVLVRTPKELAAWLEDYRPLVSRQLLERIQRWVCVGVAV